MSPKCERQSETEWIVIKWKKSEVAREREVSQERGIVVRFLLLFNFSFTFYSNFFLVSFSQVVYFALFLLLFMLSFMRWFIVNIYWPHASTEIETIENDRMSRFATPLSSKYHQLRTKEESAPEIESKSLIVGFGIDRALISVQIFIRTW